VISAVAVHFIGRPPPPEMDYILPVTELRWPVDAWATLALTRVPRLEVAKSTFVKGAIHYKSRIGKQHEKLLIVVQTPHEDTITYIVADRGPDPDHLKARRNEPSSAMSPSPAGSSADISLLAKGIWANDRIFVPGTTGLSVENYKKFLKKEQYDALCTVTLSLPMTLAQLAVLLKTVYHHSAKYDLRTYQCYWHAYTVWEILRREFAGQVSQNELQDKRGKYMNVKVRREASVEAITEAYKGEWGAFCDEEKRTGQELSDAIREVIRSILSADRC
jgi:hypothetical protein